MVIQCLRCGQEKNSLSEPPFDSELGKRLHRHTCPDCWQAWVGQQLMLMNEYRLDPMNEEHSAYLDREMVTFLSLPE